MDTELRLVPSDAKPSAPKEAMPYAEWLAAPEAFDKAEFIRETGEFLFQVYGASCQYDRHLVGMLADQMQTLVDCIRRISADNLLIEQNAGQTIGVNPAAALREKTLVRIASLMTELGLTPKARMAAGKSVSPQVGLSGFLRGPQMAK